MFTIIVSVLGIVSTIIAWKLNPRRLIYAELDHIYKKLDYEYAVRDKALAANNSDLLTIANANIIKLCTRKAVLFQRLGSGLFG
jgi:hypothetical protein